MYSSALIDKCLYFVKNYRLITIIRKNCIDQQAMNSVDSTNRNALRKRALIGDQKSLTGFHRHTNSLAQSYIRLSSSPGYEYALMCTPLSEAVKILRNRLILVLGNKNNKNLALLTTCNQSHEAQCNLRTNGSIKEAVSALAEGKRLVPVPVLEIGRGVGLHGGKWGEVPETKKGGISD